MSNRNRAQRFKDGFMHRVMNAYNTPDTDYSYLGRNSSDKPKSSQSNYASDYIASASTPTPGAQSDGETWHFDLTPGDPETTPSQTTTPETTPSETPLSTPSRGKRHTQPRPGGGTITAKHPGRGLYNPGGVGTGSIPADELRSFRGFDGFSSEDMAHHNEQQRAVRSYMTKMKAEDVPYSEIKAFSDSIPNQFRAGQYFNYSTGQVTDQAFDHSQFDYKSIDKANATTRINNVLNARKKRRQNRDKEYAKEHGYDYNPQ